MPELLAQVRIPYRDDIPADVSVNTWSFRTSLDRDDAADLIGAALLAFYNGIAEYYSPAVDLTETQGRIYDRADAVPRQPFSGGILPVSSLNIDLGLPEEVALCMSFRAVNLSGTSPKRRRGRVYLGPLNSQTLNQGQDQRAVPNPQFGIDLEAAQGAFNTALGAQTEHVIWSQANGTSSVAATYWTDNAFDTQRRRGTAPTTRRTWSA